MTKEQEAMAREAAREWGKKGGRPRTAPHVEGWKGCRCAGCREKKVRGAQVDVKVGPRAGGVYNAENASHYPVREAGQEQPSPSGFESRALHQEEEKAVVDPKVAKLREAMEAWGSKGADVPAEAPVQEGGVPVGLQYLDDVCDRTGADYRGALEQARMNKRMSKLSADERTGRMLVSSGFATWMEEKKDSPTWT
jgi:hypothetical protein